MPKSVYPRPLRTLLVATLLALYSECGRADSSNPNTITNREYRGYQSAQAVQEVVGFRWPGSDTAFLADEAAAEEGTKTFTVDKEGFKVGESSGGLELSDPIAIDEARAEARRGDHIRKENQLKSAAEEEADRALIAKEKMLTRIAQEQDALRARTRAQPATYNVSAGHLDGKVPPGPPPPRDMGSLLAAVPSWQATCQQHQDGWFSLKAASKRHWWRWQWQDALQSRFCGSNIWRQRLKWTQLNTTTHLTHNTILGSKKIVAVEAHQGLGEQLNALGLALAMGLVHERGVVLKWDFDQLFQNDYIPTVSFPKLLERARDHVHQRKMKIHHKELGKLTKLLEMNPYINDNLIYMLHDPPDHLCPNMMHPSSSIKNLGHRIMGMEVDQMNLWIETKAAMTQDAVGWVPSRRQVRGADGWGLMHKDEDHGATMRAQCTLTESCMLRYFAARPSSELRKHVDKQWSWFNDCDTVMVGIHAPLAAAFTGAGPNRARTKVEYLSPEDEYDQVGDWVPEEVVPLLFEWAKLVGRELKAGRQAKKVRYYVQTDSSAVQKLAKSVFGSNVWVDIGNSDGSYDRHAGGPGRLNAASQLFLLTQCDGLVLGRRDKFTEKALVLAVHTPSIVMCRPELEWMGAEEGWRGYSVGKVVPGWVCRHVQLMDSDQGPRPL